MQIDPTHHPVPDEGSAGLDLEVFRGELLRAEVAGEISEFHALTFHAILAMAEGSELAGDYLEMAESVAASPHEQAMVAEHRTTYDLLQGDPLASARRCLHTLEHVCQTEVLWRNLLLALCCLGDLDTLDAMLHNLARLDDELTVRLVTSLSSQPVLRAVQARPAFQELLARHAPVAVTTAAG